MAGAGFVALRELVASVVPEEGRPVPVPWPRAEPVAAGGPVEVLGARPGVAQGATSGEPGEPPGAPEPPPEPPPGPPEPPPGFTEADLEAARREGFEAGRRAAEEELEPVRRSHEAARRRLEALADGLETLRGGMAEEARRTFGALVVEVVRVLISEDQALRVALLERRLGELAAEVGGRRRLRLRVAPTDVEVARELVGAREGWTVEADDGVAAGCVAELDGGRVEGDLERLLAGLREAMAAWRAEAAALDATGGSP